MEILRNPIWKSLKNIRVVLVENPIKNILREILRNPIWKSLKNIRAVLLEIL